MTHSYRHYVFQDDGVVKRIAFAIVEKMITGRAGIPEYAGTIQRILSAVIEMEDRKPVQIVRTDASIWYFDAEGKIHRGLGAAVAEMFDSMEPDRPEKGTVVSLRPRQRKRDLQEKYRWTPTPDDINRVIWDLWPELNREAPKLEFVKARTAAVARLSRTASSLLIDIEIAISKELSRIDDLKRPDLRGVAFRARENAADRPDSGGIWLGFASYCDWRSEVLRRRRSGKGVWYAAVEVWEWTEDRDSSTMVQRYSRRCSGRQAAVEATRELLSEHAGQFDETRSIEPAVYPDLEWEALIRGEPDDASGE